MTTQGAVGPNYLLDGPEDAPVLVLSNSLGTMLGAVTETILDYLRPTTARRTDR